MDAIRDTEKETAMTTQTPTPEMIQALRDAADRHVTESAGLGADCERLAELDREDLNAIADSIADADTTNAWAIIETLDTLPRELIPSDLWVAIGGETL